jgi:hypothetical protein
MKHQVPNPEEIVKLRAEFKRYQARIQPAIDDYDRAVQDAFKGARLPEAEWLALVEIVFAKWRVYISLANEYWRDYETVTGLIG